MVSGEWYISTFLNAKNENNSDINFDITYLPIPEGAKKGTTIGTATNTGICSYSKKKDAAFVFLSYLCGKKGAEVIVKRGILPAYQDDDIVNSYLQVDPNLNLEIIFKSRVQSEMPNEVISSDLIAITKEATSRYLSGLETLEETIANWNEKRKNIISSYRANKESRENKY